jgi:guanylate kinase
MGQLFVISAPSGAGKTTIVERLKASVDAMGYCVSHTSRKPRANETDGVHYHFVDRGTFRHMAEAGAFVEWAEVYRNLYGTSFASLDQQTKQGQDILLDLDPQGAGNIKQHYPDSALIYVLPPSLPVLAQRLTSRGMDDEQTLALRLKKAADDIQNWTRYDYVIINDDLETAIGQARSIIIAERCRSGRQGPKIRQMFG